MLKAVGGAHFSFLIFGGSQVLMDIEPLVRIVRGDAVLHGPSHTLLGATIIGGVAGAIGRPTSAYILRLVGIEHRAFTWPVAFVSAFLGTYSHIGLDALMHGDMNPLWPIAPGNGLLGLIPVGALHLICLFSGVAGGATIGLRAQLAAKRR